MWFLVFISFSSWDSRLISEHTLSKFGNEKKCEDVANYLRTNDPSNKVLCLQDAVEFKEIK